VNNGSCSRTNDYQLSTHTRRRIPAFIPHGIKASLCVYKANKIHFQECVIVAGTLLFQLPEDIGGGIVDGDQTCVDTL
jgi:hypothetical protein